MSLTQAAAIFGYSRQTIASHIDAGAPAISKAGQGKAAEIDTVAYAAWLITRSRGGEDGDPYKEAMLGKLQEEEKKLAIANAQALGDLVPAEEVDALFSETLVIFRATLEGTAGRLAGGNKVLRTRLLNEFRKLLDNASGRLSKYLEQAAAKKQALKAAA